METRAMMQTERDTRTKLPEAARRIGLRLDAARDPAEMRRLITLRTGVRLALESIATAQ
jgi:hypothetical protein